MRETVKRWQGGGQKGLHLWCPGCDTVHGVRTDPPGWTWNGDSVKPTLSPSLLTRNGSDGQVCHGFVREGRFEFLNDSTHAMAGQTVDLPPWPYGDD